MADLNRVKTVLAEVNTLDTTSLVGYTYGYHAAIGICHSDNSVGEGFRFYMNALAVESLPFGHLTYLFDSISHILFIPLLYGKSTRVYPH